MSETVARLVKFGPGEGSTRATARAGRALLEFLLDELSLLVVDGCTELVFVCHCGSRWWEGGINLCHFTHG